MNLSLKNHTQKSAGFPLVLESDEETQEIANKVGINSLR